MTRAATSSVQRDSLASSQILGFANDGGGDGRIVCLPSIVTCCGEKTEEKSVDHGDVIRIGCGRRKLWPHSSMRAKRCGVGESDELMEFGVKSSVRCFSTAEEDSAKGR